MSQLLISRPQMRAEEEQPVEAAHEVTLHMIRWRNLLRAGLGNEYQETIAPVMDSLRESAQENGTSVMREFGIIGQDYLNEGKGLELMVLAAAVVELYELRERTMPGIGRG